MTAPIIIIGSGLAGYTLAREFRKLDKQSPLKIITADGGDFYSKPMLSNALAKGKSPSALVTSSVEKMRNDLDVTILTHSRVTQLHPEKNLLTTDDGEEHAYSRLVLANGASPFRLPLEGDLISINSLDDYAVFRDRLQPSSEVAIIGSGLIGCEFANDLVEAGHGVTVIGIDKWPMENLIPEQAGDYLQLALHKLGVNWQLDTSARQVEQDGDRQVISLENGKQIAADVIISAVGLRADLQLAQQAGVACGRAVSVDSLLQTSQENIYALGDVAEVEGQWLPFVMPLMSQARSLAKTLAGEPTSVSYPLMPVVVKTPASPLVFLRPPMPAVGNWQLESDETGVRALFTDRDEKLRGFVLVGAYVAEKQALLKSMQEQLD